ncbi:MAG: exo-alpha-sialidase [Clostridia bacterium]|nr:exo-alpha-sialidase [Clostridia bacterium]
MNEHELSKLLRGADVPVINHHPLPRYSIAEQDYGMTIGVAVTAGGRIYACWVGGGDNANAFFLLAYSDDDGATWSEPILAIDPHDESLGCRRCTIVGTLWVDPRNRLWLFFNQSMEHFDGSSSNWAIRCDNPDSDERSWTKPQYIFYGCTLNKPIVTRKGEWLLPVSIWKRHLIRPPFTECFHELDLLRMANIMVSTDEGETWTRRGGVSFIDSLFDEHMFVELSDDDRLWMMGRTAEHGLLQTWSPDAGKSWSAPEPAVPQSVSARFHLRKLASGRLLLIKHGKTLEKAAPDRRELTAFLSEDDGQTWSDGFLLDERFEISYPDSDQKADGSIYITYDRNRAIDGEILICKLREEDILAGKLVSEGSYLRHIAIKPGKLIQGD